jgi:hypothetical protein
MVFCLNGVPNRVKSRRGRSLALTGGSRGGENPMLARPRPNIMRECPGPQAASAAQSGRSAQGRAAKTCAAATMSAGAAIPKFQNSSTCCRARWRLRNHPPRLNYGGNGKGRQDDNSATIDRIDNARGYVRDNVLICSWKANRLKSDGTAEDHRQIPEFFCRSLSANNLLHSTSTVKTRQQIPLLKIHNYRQLFFS